MRVDSFEIKGIDRFDADRIKEGLATRSVADIRTSLSWVPVIGKDPVYFNYLEWQRDLERIRTFYRRHGYFAAEIISESIIRLPDEDAVRLTITIDEGSPTDISTISIDGLSGVEGTDLETMRQAIALSEGEVLREAEYLSSKDTLLDLLKRNGYAYAEVSGTVVVDPKKQRAQIYFFLDPGPKAVFGPLHIEGAKKIPEEAIREAIAIEPGEQYSATALQEAQEDIYELGVFSLVTVTPVKENGGNAGQLAPDNTAQDGSSGTQTQDANSLNSTSATQPSLAPQEGESDEAPQALGISDILSDAQAEAETRTKLDRVVPIVVQVKEARMSNLRWGVGFSLDLVRQDVHTIVNWRNRNLFGGLRRIEWLNRIGYAAAPGIFQYREDEGLGNTGVILRSDLSFIQPQFIERKTQGYVTALVQRDVWDGYSVWSPALRIGLRRPFFRRLYVDLAYVINYNNYDVVDLARVEDPVQSFGIDLGEDTDLVLEALEQRFSLDFRNSILNPSNGFMVQLRLQEADRYLISGEFSYIRPILEAEAYLPYELGTRWVSAVRARLGSIYDYGDPSGAPIQQRLYSGGQSAMRSFGNRYLSLFSGVDDPFPVGGTTAFEWAVEQRFRYVRNLFGVGDLWGAVFLDAGTVVAEPFLIDTVDPNTEPVAFGDLWSSLLYGVGTGAWMITPVGPVRLDFAYTISDYTNDPRFRVNCGPGPDRPACSEVDDAGDPLLAKINGWNFYIGIGHSF